jgi:transketolase
VIKIQNCVTGRRGKTSLDRRGQCQKILWDGGVEARVINLPSFELFRQQSKPYRDSVLSPNVKRRLAIEAAAPIGWHEWVGMEGIVLGMTDFGESAPDKELFKHFGFTVDRIVESVERMLQG